MKKSQMKGINSKKKQFRFCGKQLFSDQSQAHEREGCLPLNANILNC